MKKALFLFGFLLVPILIAYSQDSKGDQQSKPITLTVKTIEITCHDCQGWGWIVSYSFKLGKGEPVVRSSDSGRGSKEGTINLELVRAVCPYCGGTGKVQVKQVL